MREAAILYLMPPT